MSLLATTGFDVEAIRSQFPILQRKVNGKPLVYFDNGASSQKPKRVIDAISRYYSEYNSNIHRGVHQLSQEATQAYEDARESVRRFVNARRISEIIFTRGTTEAINLVAHSFGKKFLKENDEVIITAMEHHSNIVPWQMICEEKRAILKVIPMNEDGDLEIDKLESLITERTKLIAVIHVSNSLGTINPVREIISIARKHDIKVLLDGAQAVPHMKIDVQELDCDFYCFSGHKMFGPTGVGILYGKESLLEEMPPYQGGGEMIKTVTLHKTTYNDLPFKFEAGTPNIEAGIVLAEAIAFMEETGYDSITAHENNLLKYATESLLKIEGLRIVGTAKKKASVVSFLVDGIHPYDMGTILDKLGIAVRTGHHCTQPIMDQFCIPGTARASFALYNTFSEIDILTEGVRRAVKMLR